MSDQIRDSSRNQNLSDAKRALLEKRLRGQFSSTKQEKGIPVANKNGPIPLSFAQERLWFLHQLDPQSPAYNMYNVVRFQGVLDRDILAKSFNHLIQRHDVLRSRIVAHNGYPSQEIAPKIVFKISDIDLQSYQEQEKEIRAQEIIKAEIRRPFDLSQGPLVRALLIRQTDKDHILVLTIHHIIFDEWSNEVFWREFSEIYRALSAGETPSLPNLDIQYTDFAFWQRRHINNLIEEQLDYWKQQLRGDLSLIQLPTDRPRPAQQNFQGELKWRPISNVLYKQLIALNLELGTTMFMSLLSAFQLLLTKVTSQTDILVGTPIANRRYPETKGLIGIFLNTLVLRADLQDDMSFVEFASQTREVALNAYKYQDLPFEKMVDELHPHRDPSHNPVFQVMFVHQKSALDEIDLPELKTSKVPVDIGVSKFDLTLFAQEDNGVLNIGIEYNSDLFDGETADRILTHYQTLLENIVKEPQKKISELEILTKAEQKQILMEWNNTEGGSVPDICIHKLIEAQIAQKPNAVAVVDNTSQLCYKELNSRANQLAHYLLKLGVGPDVPVGLLLERSTNMIVAILAVLKAGGAYLPLDPTYPQERLSYMLEDTQAPVLLTQQKLTSSIPAHKGITCYLDRDWNAISRESTADPITTVRPDNLAYFIYTSGSTGKPKGVPVSHQNLVHSTFARDLYYQDKVDRFLLLSSFNFDSSIAGIFWTLCQAGKLVLPPNRIEQDMTQLAEIIAYHAVTHTLCLPSLYMLLLELADIDQLQTLQTVIVAGEECPRELIDLHFATLPQTGLYNEYGPTETTVWSTAYRIPVDFDGHHVPIGRPIPNVKNYILDRHNQLTPVGVPGELCIGGAGLTSGYLNRPDQTDQKFVWLSLKGQPAIRVYRTGDLARFLPDGNIEFLGRIDHQIKIRGNRVELGEIESILRKMTGVKDAAVIVRDDRLIAFVIPDSTEKTTLDWRAYLVNFLPDYMIPSSLLTLSDFPRTPSGKLDRKALPSLQLEEPTKTFTAPSSDTEKALAKIWSDVLGVEKIGIQDNFFDLGGDSILSIRILANANQAGLQLAPMDLFKYQTIAQLSTVVGRGTKIETEQDLVIGEVPLTPIQHWFFEQDFPQRNWWNQAVLLQCSVPLEIDKLNTALDHLLEHHDMLRARYTKTPGGWNQTIGSLKTNLTLPSYSVPSGADPLEFLEGKIVEFQSQLDLSTGPLIKGAWFAGEELNYLFLTVHHLVIDSVSWEILLEDLETAYTQLDAGKKVELPPKTTSFKHWAEKLVNYSLPAEQLDYWLTVTKGGQALPVDGVSSTNLVKDSYTITVSLPTRKTRALLQDVPSIFRTQINEALLTALLDAFFEVFALEDFLLALEGHGRELLFNDTDVSRTVGWFTSIQPVRLQRVVGSLGNRFRAVKEQLRAISDHGIGYGLLRYFGDESTQNELLNAPAPEVLFNYLGRNDDSGDRFFHPLNHSLSSFHGPNNKRSYLIEIDARVDKDELLVNWTFNPAIHKIETIEHLANSYIDALCELIAWCKTAQPAFTPSDFDLLSVDQTELDQISELFLKIHLEQPRTQIQPDARQTFSTLNNIIDILPLTEMQKLMLLHAQTARGDDVLYSQFGYRIDGPFDPAAFEQAWIQIIQRHTILRSIFLWEGLENPVQIVLKHVPVPFTFFDWRNYDPATQDEKILNFLAEDKKLGFDPTSAPLMRMSLIRTGEESWRFVWSNHHLILDRWCIEIIMRELHNYYAEINNGSFNSLPLPVQYRDYLSYILHQEDTKAANYWYKKLAGVLEPTMLKASGDGIGEGKESLRLSIETTKDLQRFAQKQRLTISTVLQGSLALLLGRYKSVDTIVYGVTVSGRPPDLAGINEILGSFINNIPFRVDCPSDEMLSKWLQSLQHEQQSLQPYQYYSPFKIQGWSNIPVNKPLFEILFLYQAPIDIKVEAFSMSQVEGGLHTNYPLTLVSEINPEGKLQLKALFDRQSFNAGYIEQLLIDWKTLMTAILTDATQPLSFYKSMIQLQQSQSIELTSSPRVLPKDHIKPSTRTERELASIWQELLDVQSVSVEDDFFALGGTSLQAMSMFVRIEEQFNVSLPLSLLFTETSILQLSERITEQIMVDENWPVLVPIQPQGSKSPFFCVHGVDGDVLGYRDLVNALGNEKPFIGLQSIGRDNKSKLDSSIQTMASRYIEAMRTYQPEGPYQIGGYCFGGVVAYEMAVQLEKMGEKVSHLAVFEGFMLDEFNARVSVLHRMSAILKNLPGWLKDYIGMSPDQLKGRFRSLIDTLERKFQRDPELKRRLNAEEILGIDYTDIPDRNIDLTNINSNAFLRYKPEKYHGKLTLFQARNRSINEVIFGSLDPKMGWGDLALGGVDVKVVDGYHRNIHLVPYVGSLAAELNKSFEDEQV